MISLIFIISINFIFNDILNRIKIGIIAITPNKEIQFINKYALKLFETTKETIITRNIDVLREYINQIDIIVEKIEADSKIQDIKRIKDDITIENFIKIEDIRKIEDIGQKIKQIEDDSLILNEYMYLQSKGGKIYNILVSIYRIYDLEKKLIGYFIKFIDISEVEKLKIFFESKMEEYSKNHEELEAIHGRNEFLSNFSHELKNLLTTIIGYIDLLKKTLPEDIAEKYKDILEVIIKSSYQLEYLTSNFIFASFHDFKELKLFKRKFNFAELINECIKSLELEFKRKKQNLVFDPGHYKDLKINADYNKIRQVIINLITNAIKYTPEKGTIIINIEKLNNDIKFTITDTGIGISKKYQDKIFQKLKRIPEYKTTTTKGIGLGLYISKKLIEMHNGEIGVVSEGINKGSTFYFIIPIE
ncbi:MAG: sensor histidine kinase [Candidatus Helarchaeota archaeon]